MAKTRIRFAVLAVIAAAVIVPVAAYGMSPAAPRADRQVDALVALNTAFTFQGRLTDAGAPANGTYDFNFYLYDALAGGSQVGPVQTRGDVAVVAGLFTVTLDFGDVFHGSQYFLEIQVRPGASAGAYTVLTPREAISAVPNASFAREAASATGLQGVPVASAAPANGDVLKFNGTNWTSAPAGAGGFALPLGLTQNHAGTLFRVTNSNTGATAAGIVAESDSTGAGAAALVGRITSTSPGAFSAGVSGINEGTGGNGIGVQGTQEGSGWGVYGETPSGVGVYGTSDAGTGVRGTTSGGTAGLFSSGTGGTALQVNGPIKVGGSVPAAFQHTVSVTTCGSGQCTTLDHPATNGNPAAIVIVTQLWTGIYNPHPVGVYYSGGKWLIFNEDLAAMPVGAQFNVLVINQ